MRAFHLSRSQTNRFAPARADPQGDPELGIGPAPCHGSPVPLHHTCTARAYSTTTGRDLGMIFQRVGPVPGGAARPGQRRSASPREIRVALSTADHADVPTRAHLIRLIRYGYVLDACPSALQRASSSPCLVALQSWIRVPTFRSGSRRNGPMFQSCSSLRQGWSFPSVSIPARR